MKRFLHTIILALILLPNFIMAQQEMGPIGSIKSFPVVYKYDEEVTWIFDLSTTSFAPGEDVYLWIWSPSEPDAGNWEDSSEFAKLTYVDNMKWTFTLTPTVYFDRTPEEIAASAGFWFRLKSDSGDKQTDVAQVPYTDFSSFATSNEIFRSYPSAPVINEGVSILFNMNLSDAYDPDTTTSVHMHSGLNFWDVQVAFQAEVPEIFEKTKLKHLGGNIFKMDLIPEEYYNTPDGYVMENMVFVIANQSWTVLVGDQVIYAGEVVPPPPPVFSFFPSQLSKKDFFGISRKNNEPGITKLIYTITAGDVELNGEFTGNMTEIKGFVNLVSALQNENVTEMHVLVKDNTDRVISDTTIPFKTVD